MDAPAAIGRYPIERALGAGAFASVWLGRDNRLDSYVAVKVLAENWAVEAAVRERFVKEARLLRQADSPRIVQVHDIGELPDGRPYFVMTYADMGSLAGRLTGDPLPVGEVLRIVGEIAEGAETLHRLGIVHRDLKPSNVLFRSLPGGGERLMLADLGIARSLADATSHTIAAGSPGYMAPEQMRIDGAPDERADVHGMGALAYHLLTGRPPAQGSVRLAPHRLRTEVPERVSAAVMKAIDPDPDGRWPSASAFAQALHDPSEAGPVPAPAASGAFLANRGRALAMGAGAVVVAGAVAAGLLMTRPGSPSTAPATTSPIASPVASPPSSPRGTHTGTGAARPGMGLRTDAGIPPQYRALIIQAGTWCDDVPGLSPALVAGVLKVASDFRADLSDPAGDEYGIGRWTPRVLQFWQAGGLEHPIPKPPLTPEVSIPAMGRFFCTLGPQVADVPADPAAKLAALYVSGVAPVRREHGVPPKWKDHVKLVLNYRDQYQD